MKNKILIIIFTSVLVVLFFILLKIVYFPFENRPITISGNQMPQSDEYYQEKVKYDGDLNSYSCLQISFLDKKHQSDFLYWSMIYSYKFNHKKWYYDVGFYIEDISNETDVISRELIRSHYFIAARMKCEGALMKLRTYHPELMKKLNK